MTGHDLIRVRELLGGARRVSPQDLVYELGLQRDTYARAVARPDEPLMSPKLELLIRLLQRWPEISILQHQQSVADAVALLDSIHPDVPHSARNVAVLCASEASVGRAWAQGGPLSQGAQRLLRALMLVVGEAPAAEREACLAAFEEEVHWVARSHGLTPEALRSRGFAGFRKARKKKWRSTKPPPSP